MNENPVLWVGLFCCLGPALIFSAGAFAALAVQRFRRRFAFVDRRALAEVGYAGSGDGELAAQLRSQQSALSSNRLPDAPTTWSGGKYRADLPPGPAPAARASTTTRKPSPPPSSSPSGLNNRVLRGGHPQPETPAGDAYGVDGAHEVF